MLNVSVAQIPTREIGFRPPSFERSPLTVLTVDFEEVDMPVRMTHVFNDVSHTFKDFRLINNTKVPSKVLAKPHGWKNTLGGLLVGFFTE